MNFQENITRRDFLRKAGHYGEGFTGLFLLSSPIILAACKERNAKPLAAEQIAFILTPETATMLRERLNFWPPEQLARVQLKDPFKVDKKPVQEPVRYISYKQSDLVLLDDFGDFMNSYVYGPDKTLKGAQTTDRNGRIIAEAVLDYPPRETVDISQAHWHFREVHYNPDREIQFAARSEIDPTGRIQEIASAGTRKGDFYFFFPRFP